MEIPVKNIYFLLCYAWNKLEESEKVQVDSSDYDDALNLFTRVLVNGCRYLFKRGLDRNYNSVEEEYAGIKGKIDFNASLNKNLFKQGKAICHFDQFEYNVIQNQIIKSVLGRIIKVRTLDRNLKKEVWDCFYRFHQVEEINIQLQHFSKVRIHRNNSFYDLLLRIARLIVENTVISDSDGKYTFVDFYRNEKAMAYLFEGFVRNFYKKEQSYFRVRREDIQWKAVPLENSDVSLLPKMQTDITLESFNKKIVMDTKYYKKTLAFNYSEKFHSRDLFQIYSYLRNLEEDTSNPNNENCDGMLVYPTVQKEINEAYQIGNHKIKIATVDLSKDWHRIHSRLINLISQN
jgi:5-methylcytosine-specific restriction enzyme subunit McrC